MMPSGAVRNTRKSREKLWSCTMSTPSMSTNIKGKSLKIEALALPDSSTAPPVSMR